MKTSIYTLIFPSIPLLQPLLFSPPPLSSFPSLSSLPPTFFYYVLHILYVLYVLNYLFVHATHQEERVLRGGGYGCPYMWRRYLYSFNSVIFSIKGGWRIQFFTPPPSPSFLYSLLYTVEYVLIRVFVVGGGVGGGGGVECFSEESVSLLYYFLLNINFKIFFCIMYCNNIFIYNYLYKNINIIKIFYLFIKIKIYVINTKSVTRALFLSFMKVKL